MPELDRLVHITVNVTDYDDEGNPVAAPVYAADVWARREDYGVSSRFDEGGVRSASSSVFQIRYHPQIASAQPVNIALAEGDQNYRISRVNELDIRRRFLRLEGTRST